MKRRRLNKKRCGIALLCLILFVFCIFWLFSTLSKGENRKKRKQLELAAEYLEELDYEQAVAAYINVLEIDPKNVDAIYGLCDAYIAWADTIENPGEQLRLMNKALMKVNELFRHAAEEYRWAVYDLCYKISEIYEANGIQEASQKYWDRCIDIDESEAGYAENVLKEVLAGLPEEISRFENGELRSEQEEESNEEDAVSEESKEAEIDETYKVLLEELANIAKEGDHEKILETISRDDYMAMANTLGKLSENGCYVGERNEQGKRDGKGVAVYGLYLKDPFGVDEDYSTYHPAYYYGEWKDGKRNGKGYWFFVRDDSLLDGKGGQLDDTPEGFFELEWVDDIPNGHMKYTDEHSCVTEGQVVDGLFDGEIRQTNRNPYVNGGGPTELIYRFDNGKAQPIREEAGQSPWGENYTRYILAENGSLSNYIVDDIDMKHGVLGYGQPFIVLWN